MRALLGVIIFLGMGTVAYAAYSGKLKTGGSGNSDIGETEAERKEREEADALAKAEAELKQNEKFEGKPELLVIETMNNIEASPVWKLEIDKKAKSKGNSYLHALITDALWALRENKKIEGYRVDLLGQSIVDAGHFQIKINGAYKDFNIEATREKYNNFK